MQKEEITVDSQNTIITQVPSVTDFGIDSYPPKHATVYSFITVVWLLTSLMLLVKFFLENLYLLYLQKSAVQAKQSYLDTCKTISYELGIQSPIVLQSTNIASPFAFGMLNPYIILPMGKHELELPDREVFLHELAHLKRHDPFWNHLTRVSKILIPFQPLLWILARGIADTSDYVCDDYVMNSVDNHKMYARQLVNLAQRYHSKGCELQGGVGFISFTSSLRRRIGRILDATHTLSLKAGARFVLYISFICTFITFVTGLIGIRGKNIAQNSYASGKIRDKENKGNSIIYSEAEPSFADSSIHTQSPVKSKTNDDSSANIDRTVDKQSSTSDPSESAKIPLSEETHTASVVQHPQQTDTEKGIEFPNTIKEPVTETEKKADNTFHTAKINKDIGQTGENGAETISEEQRKNIAITKDSDTSIVSKIESHTLFETAASYAVSSGEINDLALKAIDVVISYDFENADLSDPEEKKLFSIYMSLNKNKMFPVWSPDGKWIAFSDRNFGIWVVPSEGGEPRLLYENYYSVKYKEYSLHLNGLKTLGFSPDGKKVTFIKYIIDEERGTEVFFDKVDQNTFSNIINPVPVIATVDIHTKESSVLVENAVSGRWSNSGRYFAYIRRNMGSYNELLVYDTETGNEWEIDSRFPESVFFSHDDTYIYYSDFELFKVPLHGGEPEQLSDFGLSYISDYSNDGEWILYADDNFNQGVYNTISGENLDALPWAAFKTYWTNFSPDGKKICFGLKHEINDEIEWGIYTYDFDLPSEQTGIDEINIPLDFKLHVNYPNPFNSSTTIEFSLAESNHTTLVVYNLAGQKIRELVSEYLTPGTHRINWNGRDDNGKKVSSGVYLPTLKSGVNFDTGRITMVK